MRVAIVGCGLIGTRRARVVRASPRDELVAVVDVDESRAHRLAGEMGCRAATDWREVVGAEEVEAVVVSTPNKFLMPITVAVLEHHKHVLCEKPLGRSSCEAQQMVAAARTHHVILKTGFNHRHHPAIARAHELCSSGAIGKLLFIRSVYGHGGRPGYEREWRADPEIAGGGDLLDQGIHVIDLCRWFLGDIAQVSGFTPTYFWGADKMSAVEDNAFALLQMRDGRSAAMHTSWTQWKNRFSFEIFGRDGYISVDGLGGSYGVERLTLGTRRPESGPPYEEQLEFNATRDESWSTEWEEFTTAIREGREPMARGTGRVAVRM